MSEPPSAIKPGGLPPDFDPTAELWDRLVDDITRQGTPCLETVERLVDDACHQPARIQAPKAQPE